MGWEGRGVQQPCIIYAQTFDLLASRLRECKRYLPCGLERIHSTSTYFGPFGAVSHICNAAWISGLELPLLSNHEANPPGLPEGHPARPSPSPQPPRWQSGEHLKNQESGFVLGLLFGVYRVSGFLQAVLEEF